MPVELANLLNQLGIDTVTVRDLDMLGNNDHCQLRFATEQGRILCTYDSDYIGLAKQGIEHAGIIFVPGRYRDIGVMVEYLRSVYVFYSLDDMENRLEYLSIL